MQTFLADACIRFDAENLDAIGEALRRLAKAAESAGFVMNAKVTPAPADEQQWERGTPYALLTPADDS